MLSTPLKAYDIEILTDPFDRVVHDGWCFGLPPGIDPEQWPIDPANGYPLQHGFTLLLPEDWRCHGSEIVAISFFASAVDLNDGGAIVKAPKIAEAMKSAKAGEPEPEDPELAVFWRAERLAHSRLQRFEDDIGMAYAAMLLTRAEFEGQACSPPDLVPNQYRDLIESPEWLEVGAAKSYWNHEGKYRWVGSPPNGGLCERRALRLTTRTGDQNAGRVPCDRFDSEQTDYVHPLYEAPDAPDGSGYRWHTWAENRPANHLGGTMRPSQSVPRFSPYFIEFEEELGGYNFGGGNAQLDVRELKFDWACG